MRDQLVTVRLTAGELGALRSWLDYGGVVGETEESDLSSACTKLRDADVHNGDPVEEKPSHWPRATSGEPQVGS